MQKMPFRQMPEKNTTNKKRAFLNPLDISKSYIPELQTVHYLHPFQQNRDNNS